jgi:y4mF family transcriptional regulator
MKIKTSAELGQIIQTIRKKQKLTQGELAASSGVGVRFIVDLEKGKPTAAIGKAIKVIQMLGIEIDLKPPKVSEE